MGENLVQSKDTHAATMSIPSAHRTNDLVHFLIENFTPITDVDEIARFARSHPGGEAALRDCLPVAKRIFGGVKPLLVIGQGFEDAVDDYLAVLIPNDDEVEEAFRKLNSFRDWWYQIPLSSTGALFFDVKMI